MQRPRWPFKMGGCRNDPGSYWGVAHMHRAFGIGFDTSTPRGALAGVLCFSCAVLMTLGSPRIANSQPIPLHWNYNQMNSQIVTRVEGPITALNPPLRATVCPPNRPYYKPQAYSRYMRHRFRPFRDYYPFDPPYRCAAWPWSTHVCVGAYVAPHPLPVGVDCTR
jgi:hypothetical protein